MTNDNKVEIPADAAGSAADTATLLLAAAEELGLNRKSAVRTTSLGTFVVSKEVAEKAGVSKGKESKPKPKRTARTAKKSTPAKKAATKKDAADTPAKDQKEDD